MLKRLSSNIQAKPSYLKNASTSSKLAPNPVAQEPVLEHSDTVKFSSKESLISQILQDREWVPGELMLQLAPSDAHSLKGSSPLERLGLTIEEEFDFDNRLQSEKTRFLHVKLPQDLTVKQALTQLIDDPQVLIAEPNFSHTFKPEELTPQAVSSSPGENLEQQQWSLNNTGQTGGTNDADIDAPEAWLAYGVGRGVDDAQGALVAVNDSGVQIEHPDLKDNIFVNHDEIPNNGIDDDNNGYIDDYTGWNAALKNGDVSDTYGHGTHCAGIIAADGTNDFGVSGINKKAKILPVKILNGATITMGTIVRALKYSKAMGVRVTSNSWRFPKSMFVKAAFSSNPAVHAFSAGNNTKDNDAYDHYPSNYKSPRKSAVAAIDHNNEKAPFSNYGSTTVEIGAPGKDILSTIPNKKYGLLSGTSMAAPHVAGAALMIANYFPQLSSEEIITCIHQSGDKNDALDGITTTGTSLNLKSALDAARHLAQQKSQQNLKLT